MKNHTISMSDITDTMPVARIELASGSSCHNRKRLYVEVDLKNNKVQYIVELINSDKDKRSFHSESLKDSVYLYNLG